MNAVRVSSPSVIGTFGGSQRGKDIRVFDRQLSSSIWIALLWYALDAHDLAGTLKLAGKEGSFRGTVSKFFEERDGDLIVFDFDPNYRTAVTAVLKNPDFPKFPDVKTLAGKEIVVSGKFVSYHGKAQIELTDPKQIKVVR